LPDRRKTRVVPLLGFGLRVFVVRLLLLPVATACVIGTRGYSMHAPSWYRVGTFFRSGYPVAVDARMLQQHKREPAARAVWCRLSGHNSASSSAAGRRWTLLGDCEPLMRWRRNRAAAARRLVLRLSRCSRAPCLAALRIVHSRSLVVRCLGLSIRPLSVAASLAALPPPPSLPHSPSPLCLPPLPLLPPPPSSLTRLFASYPEIAAPQKGDGSQCSRSYLRATRAQSR